KIKKSSENMKTLNIWRGLDVRRASSVTKTEKPARSGHPITRELRSADAKSSAGIVTDRD
ncbi:hypothetical protein H0H81_001558, partial [Sphagnurus paluster]